MVILPVHMQGIKETNREALELNPPDTFAAFHRSVPVISNVGHMEKLTLEQKKAWVFGLLIDCPFGKTLDDCPVKDARCFPLLKRMNLLRRMDENDIDGIIVHHQKCLSERERR